MVAPNLLQPRAEIDDMSEGGPLPFFRRRLRAIAPAVPKFKARKNPAAAGTAMANTAIAVALTCCCPTKLSTVPSPASTKQNRQAS